MKRLALVAALAAFVGFVGGCASDPENAADTSGADTASADTVNVDTASSDVAVADTAVADTATPPDTVAPADTQADDTVADTGAPEPDAVADAAGDTGTGDAAPDTEADAVTPECVLDTDCDAAAIVPPPNECVVPRCIDGSCQTSPRDCADSDPCTLDACDPHMGCLNPEFHYDIGSSRVWFCPGLVTENDARTTCTARGGELAYVVTAQAAAAYSALLGDFGAPDVWVNPQSVNFCDAAMAFALPVQCRALDTAACTIGASCSAAKPFLCEISCNDGDPCTLDYLGNDGLCHHGDAACDDGDACTVDACNPNTGCVHTLPVGLCDDNVPCTTDSCDPATGACAHNAVRTTWDATHQLLACPGPLTWAAARTRCAVEGAVLAMPVSDAHKTQLAAIAQSLNSTEALWAPLKQQDGGNQPWNWVDAGGSGSPPWCASVQPNFSEAGYCAHWSTSAGCLTNSPCDQLRSFGCVVDTSIP